MPVGEGRWRVEVACPYFTGEDSLPATRSAHSFLKFRAYPLNVVPSGFRVASEEEATGDGSLADPYLIRNLRSAPNVELRFSLPLL